MVWLILGTGVTIFLHVEIFVPLNNFLKIFNIFPLVFYWAIFLFTMVTAASVIYHVDKSYKLLNSLFLEYMESNKPTNKHGRAYKQITMLKISTIIERLAKKKDGISCWTLFTINYFRVYGVSYTSLP